MLLKPDNIVVLDEVRLTNLITIQKIAYCNRPMENGKLPYNNGDPDFACYIRVKILDGEHEGQITDYSGDVFGRTDLNEVFSFLIRNKEESYPKQ